LTKLQKFLVYMVSESSCHLFN